MLSYLQRQNRLGPNRQFSYVYRRGKRAAGKNLSLFFVRNSQKRFGFSVNKKVGVAVKRNRTKRRLRECVRAQLPQLKNGLYVFVARPGCAECSFEQLRGEMARLLKKADCFLSSKKPL